MKVILTFAACIVAAAVPDGSAGRQSSGDWAGARAAATSLPRLHSLLVSHRGGLVFEYYARGHTASRLANIKSASKSVISTLVGIAIERKLIPGLDTPIVRWFPELRADPDARKQAITIEDLLTMRSGLASTSGENYGRWVNSSNWVRHALSRPMVSEPGTSMEYSTGTSHILSAILTKVSKTSTHAFAVEALAKPIGITLARWPRDPQGIYLGGNEMLMTSRQMIELGELYLNRGRARDRVGIPIVNMATAGGARRSTAIAPASPGASADSTSSSSATSISSWRLPPRRRRVTNGAVTAGSCSICSSSTCWIPTTKTAGCRPAADAFASRNRHDSVAEMYGSKTQN